MPDLGKLPSRLRELVRVESIAGVPALVGHPSDFASPVPLMLWMHGRTVSKELDPGRYLRWLRAGIGVLAVDLPGHGSRADAPRHGPDQTLGVVGEMLGELDGVLRETLSRFDRAFDADRLGIGGMSAGGMVTLRRLCDLHSFKVASVEGTCGRLQDLYGEGRPIAAGTDPAALTELDPSLHLDGFEPMPLLALHSEADELVPWSFQKRFLDDLRAHYQRRGSDPDMVSVHTWPTTGAPYEHAGFGRVASEAKDIQLEFLSRHLLG